MGSEIDIVMLEDIYKNFNLEEIESIRRVCIEGFRVKGRFMNIFLG